MSVKRSIGVGPFVSPAPSFLIACYDQDGKPNVMTAAWAGICCSKPLSIAVGIQPIRHSHDAILARAAFTVNVPPVSLVKEVDFVGIYSGRKYDKFAMAGLTPVRAEKVDAPYVAECPVILECALTFSKDLGMHTLMIGEVLDVKADEACLDPKSEAPDCLKVDSLVFDSGTRAYYSLGKRVAEAFSVGKQLLKGEEG